MNYLKTCLREQSSGEICQPPIYEEQEHIKHQLYSYVKYVKNMHIAWTFNRGCLINDVYRKCEMCNL